MTMEPIHLLPEVTCNRYIISIQNLVPETSIAGKRGNWPASEDVLLPYPT